MPWKTLTGPLAVLWNERPYFSVSQTFFITCLPPTPRSPLQFAFLIALFSHETVITQIFSLLSSFLSIHPSIPIYLYLVMYCGPLESHKSLHLSCFSPQSPPSPLKHEHLPRGDTAPAENARPGWNDGSRQGLSPTHTRASGKVGHMEKLDQVAQCPSLTRIRPNFRFHPAQLEKCPPKSHCPCTVCLGRLPCSGLCYHSPPLPLPRGWLAIMENGVVHQSSPLGRDTQLSPPAGHPLPTLSSGPSQP